MLRFLKLVVLGIIMIAIILVAVANRDPVTLELLPSKLAPILPLSVELPLFMVVLVSILVGLMIGYILEWLREHKHRKTAAQKKREVGKLEREVETLKKKDRSEADEILALLN